MTNEQIVSLYEDNGLEIEQIAEQLEMDMLSVKTALAQGSSIYRNNSRNGFEEAITDEEFKDLKQRALDLARFSTNEHVQSSMIKFLFEQRMMDKRGANAVPHVNVMLLQQVIGGAREKINKSLGKKELVESVGEIVEV